MKVVITAATTMELINIKKEFELKQVTHNIHHHEVKFFTSGVGILTSTFSLSKLLFQDKPDLIIQVGIAGSFDHSINLASVVAVKNEFLGDIGVQENGQFKDIFDLKFQDDNDFPFSNKALANPTIEELNYLSLQLVNSVTVNEVTTNIDKINQLKNKYAATIESMEGAALHYTCLSTNTRFIQLRATSNFIGERNKNNWKIKEALNQLQEVTLAYMNKLNELKKGIIA